MTPTTLSLLSAVLVAIILWRVWKGAPDCENELLPREVEDQESARCPQEFVAALFRREDWQFVSQFDSEPLKALFLSERKSLAIAWVRATASYTSRIMSEHTLASRSSSDLDVSTEAQIYLQYVTLRAACILLHFSIVLLGPVRLGSLSQRVYRMSERLSAAHEGLLVAHAVRKLQGT